MSASSQNVSHKQSRFFIELPFDDYWNTKLPPAVIQAVELPVDENGDIFLKVVAPAVIALHWRRVNMSSFVVCSGPARELRVDGYVNEILSLFPNLLSPKGSK